VPIVAGMAGARRVTTLDGVPFAGHRRDMKDRQQISTD